MIAVLAIASCGGSEETEGNTSENKLPLAESPSIAATKTTPAKIDPPPLTPKADDAKPAEHEAAIVALEDLAELMCSCTTPSCVHRVTTKVEKWKRTNEDRMNAPSSAQKQRIDDSIERVVECAETAAEDE